MIPSTTGAVLAFFLFVAPGLLFDLLAAKRRAGVPETSFREASRVVLASTLFTGSSALLLTVPCLAVASARRWISGWLKGETTLSPTQPAVLLAMLVVALTACGIAALVHWRLARSGSPLRQVSTWTQAFRADVPSGSAPYVRVKTTSGSTYTGFIGSYTPDLEASGRELVLVPPLWSAAPGKTLDAVPAWSRIILRGDEVSVLMVDYRPDPNSSSELATNE